MEIRISEGLARTTLKILLIMALILCSTSFASTVVYFYHDQDIPREFLGVNFENGIGILDVNAEANIPTWFSSSVLLLCSALLAVIAGSVNRVGARYTSYWVVLSIVFVLLSFDEAVSVHERLTEPLRSFLDTDGLLYFAWVIPAGAFVVIFGIAYMRFLFKLPVRIRSLFIAAGALYVSGSLGIEMLEGLVVDLRGWRSLLLPTLFTVEEFLEMCGAIIFLYALMRYIELLQKFSNRISSQTPAKEPPETIQTG